MVQTQTLNTPFKHGMRCQTEMVIAHLLRTMPILWVFFLLLTKKAAGIRFLTPIPIVLQQLNQHILTHFYTHSKVVTTCKPPLQTCTVGSWPPIIRLHQQSQLKQPGVKTTTQAR